MAKLISIIIATYNAQSVIEDCLNSIFQQELNDIEVILVDGASSDKTVELVKAHPLVCKIFSEKDDGIYDAWNTGVALAEGEWLMFVGADDLLTQDLLQTLKLEIQRSCRSVNYISGRNKMILNDGALQKFIGAEVTKSGLLKNMVAAHVGSLHHRSLFLISGLFNKNYKIAGDYEFLLRNVEFLVPRFLPIIFCEAKIGGVSYSYKAILEADRVRNLHNPRKFYRNKFLLMKYLIVFSLIKLGVKR